MPYAEGAERVRRADCPEREGWARVSHPLPEAMFPLQCSGITAPGRVLSLTKWRQKTRETGFSKLTF